MKDDLSLPEEKLEKDARRTIRDHWRLFFFQGLLLAAAGLAAVIVPHIASLAIAIFIGWLLIACGALRLAADSGASGMSGFWGQAAVSVLMMVLGGVLLFQPAAAALTLTMVLTAYFLAHGIASFVFAYAIRGDTDRWPWLLLSGLVDLVLAGLIVAGWPGTAEWVLGLLVGINLLFTGLVLMFAALGAGLSEE
jgi:uncharacterized membrane protein HdeD (DUF308 family)